MFASYKIYVRIYMNPYLLPIILIIHTSIIIILVHIYVKIITKGKDLLISTIYIMMLLNLWEVQVSIKAIFKAMY